MENKKIIIYVLAGFYIISIILGLILVFKSDPKKETKMNLSSLSSFSGKDKDGIAVLYIYGPIRIEERESIMPGMSMDGADQIVKRLEKIRKNPKIKAVVLRINSPGGTVAACQEIFEEIKKLKQKGVKIVASMGDVAASGGYYIACIADKIVANPGTITGSIGVIAEVGNIDALFKKIGVKIEVIKSGKYKDIGSYSRDMTEEERQIFQNLIDNSYNQFINAISFGRGIPLEKVREWADGSVVTGEIAKNRGIVDELGNLPDAIKLAGELSKLGPEPVIIKDYNNVFENFFDLLGHRFDDNNSLSKILTKPKFRLEYMME